MVYFDIFSFVFDVLLKDLGRTPPPIVGGVENIYLDLQNAAYLLDDFAAIFLQTEKVYLVSLDERQA